MKLAFVLFNFFPSGGLTRDALAIARECKSRGYQVCFFVRENRGAMPDAFTLKTIPVRATTNHKKNYQFAKKVSAAAAQFGANLIVGFNKMKGLDIYYAADGCVADKYSNWWWRINPRVRVMLAMEKSVFANNTSTEILTISPPQQILYQKYYATPKTRLTLLPPGIARDRMVCAAHETRAQLRKKLNLSDADKLLLCVGSGYKTKGVDRSIRALASTQLAKYKTAKLCIIGANKTKPYKKLADKLNISARVEFLGARDDIGDFLAAADLLLHPARYENTGTVLLEAIIAGLPVATTDVCGYESYVRAQKMGAVVGSPFSQEQFNYAVAELLDTAQDGFRKRGKKFAATADIYNMPKYAVTRIEQIYAAKQK